MSQKYYFSPYQQLFRIGGGRFSLINPGSGIPSNTARLAVYGTWNSEIGNQFQAVNAVSGNGEGKNWCMAWVRNDDETIHNLIVEDASIGLIPFSPTDLNEQAGTLVGSTQTAIVNQWESKLLDATWITPVTLVREILGYALRIILACGQMGIDYPEVSLSSRWNTIASGQRNAIEAWLRGKGLPVADINNNTPVRDVVTRISMADFGAIRFGNEFF